MSFLPSDLYRKPYFSPICLPHAKINFVSQIPPVTESNKVKSLYAHEKVDYICSRQHLSLKLGSVNHLTWNYCSVVNGPTVSIACFYIFMPEKLIPNQQHCLLAEQHVSPLARNPSNEWPKKCIRIHVLQHSMTEDASPTKHSEAGTLMHKTQCRGIATETKRQTRNGFQIGGWWGRLA